MTKIAEIFERLFAWRRENRDSSKAPAFAEWISNRIHGEGTDASVAWIDRWVAESHAGESNTVLNELTFWCGGYFSGHFAFIIKRTNTGYRLCCDCDKRFLERDRLPIPPEWIDMHIGIPEMNRFVGQIFGQLRIHRWKREYWKQVCDGTQWTVEMVFADETRERLEFGGSNAWPGNWSEFIEVFANLVRTVAIKNTIGCHRELHCFTLQWFAKDSDGDSPVC